MLQGPMLFNQAYRANILVRNQQGYAGLAWTTSIQVYLLISSGSFLCWSFFFMVCWACQGHSRLLITCLPWQWHISRML